jgi:CRISPR-associated endonuclease/helicase Cas3
MIDVAEVTGALWDRCLGGQWRQSTCATLGWDEETTRRGLMFWAALHDLGKASPSFQRRHPPAIARLEAQGLPFIRRYGSQAAYHGLITAWAMGSLQAEICLPPQAARDLAKALGGHHGSWPPPGAIGDLDGDVDNVGTESWTAARFGLFRTLQTLYSPARLANGLGSRAERQAFVTLVGGLVSVADWIGSMDEYFAPTIPQSLDAYASQARATAERAIHDLSWDVWQPPTTPAAFEQLFPQFPPNAMQRCIIDLAPQLDGPSLVLIEAPTGSGKTEAALYLADQWAQRFQQRGLYVAMPTTATSNAMYGRVVEMMDRRYGEGRVAPLLIHSQSRWTGPPTRMHTDAEGDDEAGTNVDVMRWFLPRKRSLLAPLGVGTVDQALLSVLLTRHFFVRLFGLAHKTIIFDEVHAYDTYMSTLFARLLSWLRAADCSVVMLSATLPDSTRRAFLNAYGADQASAEAQVRYPAVTWACGAKAGCVPLPPTEDRQITLSWHPHDDETLVATLRDALTDGGCAAVLCNTVHRAQEVYRALRQAAVVPEDDLTLFHGRFPQAWRDDIEKKVLSRYDKASTPCVRRGIVVATQVIEQSLDLDFDLMVTDLAPIDLLLQRAGRLHRHPNRDRPSRLRCPRLVLIEPQSAEELPDWGSDGYVYEPYVLLRTLEILRGRTSLRTPSQTQQLIEAVYGEEEQAVSGPLADALAKARDQRERHRREHSQIARQKLVLPPKDEDYMAQQNPAYVEDSPDVHRSLQALTRLSEPSMTLVCLHLTQRGLALEPEGCETIDLLGEPGDKLTRELVRHSVSVSHWRLVPWFSQQEVPCGWRRHPLLRFDRPVVFEQSVCRLDGCGYKLRLSRELGLQIEKEEI